MMARFDFPRTAPRIHAPNCHCPRCRHHRRQLVTPTERQIRTIMFTIAGTIGLTLGILVTPQQIIAAIAATL